MKPAEEIMRALDRKLLRDVWHLRGQLLAISLVLACGVATFVMSLSTLRSLERAQETYYAQYNFADVFAQLKRAPGALAAQLAEVPGVARVETRIVRDVTLDVADFPEPVVGRLISFPRAGGQALNRLHLRRGRLLEADRQGEVLVDESFAAAHGLNPGERLVALLNGRRRELRIAGVVLSPEYIYQIRPGDLLPDPHRFGILWLREPEMAAAFDMIGAFNDIAIRLMPGAVTPEVLQRLDQLLAPYGSLGAYDREDQASHQFVSNEIRELRGMAVVAPLIFLAVAAFLLNVVMNRLIGAQREQIATLKAFGYSRWEVGGHYAKFVLVIAAVGMILGTAAGAWMGSGITALYIRFFQFPVFLYHLPLAVVFLAMAVSLAAALLGTFGAVRRAMALPPAEAMRPEPPAQYRPTLLERLGLQGFFSPPLRMILRTLERQGWKSFLSILGIALAAAVLVLGSFSLDAINYVIDLQFRLAQRQDVTVTLVESTGKEALYELSHLPGVRLAEPFRAVPVRLRHEHRARRLAIMGLSAGDRLNRIMDMQGRVVEIPEDGIVVSAKLARILQVKVGDVVTAEVMEGERPTLQIPVAALVEDFAGLNAYMNRSTLNRRMREGERISGAFLAVDAAARERLYQALKNTPSVASVTVKEAALASFRDTVAENLLRMRFFNILFATIIAIGVVYNNARIGLSERSRELATLRVIGFTRVEVSSIFLGELAVMTIAALPLGLALGYGFAALTTRAFDTELFRIPLIVNRSTYGFAALVVLIAAALSGLLVRRRIDRLDLVAVLKSRD